MINKKGKGKIGRSHFKEEIQDSNLAKFQFLPLTLLKNAESDSRELKIVQERKMGRFFSNLISVPIDRESFK